MSNFKKIRPVGDELLDADRWTDGRTDMTKLIVAFRNFAKAPKNMLDGSTLFPLRVLEELNKKTHTQSRSSLRDSVDFKLHPDKVVV
jgi:hypothetical protein